MHSDAKPLQWNKIDPRLSFIMASWLHISISPDSRQWTGAVVNYKLLQFYGGHISSGNCPDVTCPWTHSDEKNTWKPFIFSARLWINVAMYHLVWSFSFFKVMVFVFIFWLYYSTIFKTLVTSHISKKNFDLFTTGKTWCKIHNVFYLLCTVYAISFYLFSRIFNTKCWNLGIFRIFWL